jgi:MFS family permease
MMSLGVTLIGDIFSDRARAVAMGYRSSAQSIVNVGIPFISGTVATLTWFYPFLIYILALPLALFVSLRLNLEDTRNRSTLRDYFKTIITVIRDKKTLWVYISNFFIFIFLFCLIVYGPILVVEDLGLSTMYTGLLLSTGSAVAAITASQAGRLFYRLRNYQIISLGFLFGGMGLLLISFTPNYAFLLACVIVWGVGFGLAFPALNTIVTQLVSSHLRAGVVSGFTAMTYIGQSVSPPIFGFILGKSDLQTVFLFAGILTLIPIAFTFIMHFVYGKV